MSYFARLVRQAQLTIGEATHEREPAVDLVELGTVELVETPLVDTRRPAARPLVPVDTVDGDTPTEPPEVARQAVPARAPTLLCASATRAHEASNEIEAAGPEPRHDDVAVVHRVLEWVRAGNEQRDQPVLPGLASHIDAVIDAKTPVGAPETGTTPELPSVTASPQSARAMSHDAAGAEAGALAELEVPALASAPAARPSGESRPGREPAPSVEDVIEVSIGTINVRIDAPPPPVQPVSAARAPESSAAPRNELAPPARLARYYLQP